MTQNISMLLCGRVIFMIPTLSLSINSKRYRIIWDNGVYTSFRMYKTNDLESYNYYESQKFISLFRNNSLYELENNLSAGVYSNQKHENYVDQKAQSSEFLSLKGRLFAEHQHCTVLWFRQFYT